MAPDDPGQKTNGFAEVWMNLSQAGLDGYLSFQERWLEILKPNASDPDRGSWQTSVKESVRGWGEFYEKGLRQFLMVPPVGITRYYQERMAELLDKFNQFQAKMAEFICLLTLPLERSLKGTRERVDAVPRNGEMAGDARVQYQTWLKTLEDYYSSLFNSDEYTRTMSSTMEALEDLAMARQRFVESFLRAFSIPTSTDFDDLSKEVYLLKKKVRELTGKLEER